MSKHQNTDIEEPFMVQEVGLGICVAVGVLLMGVSEVIGMLAVLLASSGLAWVYLVRIIRNGHRRRTVAGCYFGWLNNAVMLIALAGILMLMLMDRNHLPVFIAGMAAAFTGILTNAIVLRREPGGMLHLSLQLRLLIAMVVMVVFFLL
jgi:hypothetical protein